MLYKLFWYKEWCAAMADKLTDLVYADDSKETIDVINVLLLGWILLGLVVYVLGNVIAAYLRRNKKKGGSKRIPDDDTPNDSPCAVAATPKSTPDETEPPPTCEGEEREFCEWVGGVLAWVHSQRVVSPLVDAWLDALNASTRIAAAEHGLLVDFRNLLPTFRPPKVKRLAQVAHRAVECDMEFSDAAFELGVCRLEEGGHGRQPPLPYLLHLHSLTGKVFVECIPGDVSFVAKYLESPQMELHAEPSNEMSPPDGELCDAVCEVSRDALRCSCLHLRLACFPGCPRHATPTTAEEGRKLLVRVVKANNLSSGMRPFCILEVDDPPQRHATPPAHGSDPHFDMQFTLSVKDSTELLFEVKEKGTSGEDELLGLCMVEVEELLCHPRQRQVVPLQSMHHDRPVTGTLTLEFVFPERRVETNSRVTAAGTLITTTTTTIRRTNEEDVAGRALAQLGSSPSGTSRSTLIIHSVHRENPQSSIKVSMDINGRWQEVPEPESSLDDSPAHSRSEPPSPPHHQAEAAVGNGRRGVVGALRRRLSLRSRSSERSNPASPRRTLAGSSSTRSSLSEASGVSAATFIHENSTLVIETNENGVVRRYLIPGALAHRSKRPRGAKLHIFNDHVFVARHLAGSVMCAVCERHLLRRPGKQGYECRGCGVRCHKSCHVRVEDFCPNSSVNAMEVEYIHDPKGAYPKSI